MATRKTVKNSRAAARKAKKRQQRIILFIIEILVLVILLLVLFTVFKTEKIQKITVDEENIVFNENVENNEALKGYHNIALFGVDSRDKTLGKGNRSDTIMIASVNEETGDIKLCSVYRDTYLNLSNDSYNKCNSAYAKGGPEQAIIMLNMNLDMNITDYVTIGFEGLTKVIDALGGVPIDVTEAEMKHLNNYQISMVGKTTDGTTFTATEGKDYIPVTTPGLQVLNGLQATAYCRIRYIGDDFERTRRQRTVLQAVMDKAQTLDFGTLNKILDDVLPNVATSLDVDDMVAMLKDVAKYHITGSEGLPFEQYRATGKVGSKGSCVIPNNLASNVSELHKFLFGEENYQVSPEVQSYSDKISADTGY